MLLALYLNAHSIIKRQIIPANLAIVARDIRPSLKSLFAYDA
jgi:hypothetical protein